MSDQNSDTTNTTSRLSQSRQTEMYGAPAVVIITLLIGYFGGIDYVLGFLLLLITLILLQVEKQIKTLISTITFFNLDRRQ